MNCFEEDVLKYSIISMLELAKSDSNYDFAKELNDFKNSDFFKSLSISEKEINSFISKYINDLDIKNLYK